MARKLRVWEVSFAKRPKNKEMFILKEDNMDKERLGRLVAQLAMQADVPEVVKEELKDLAGEPLQKDEVLDILGLKAESPYEGIPEELKKELEERDKRIFQLELETFRKELEPRVGEDAALLVELKKDGVEDGLLSKLTERIEALRKAVDELGGPKGDPRSDGPDVEKEIERVMKEKGLPRGDAIVELAKEKPELIEQWG